MLTNIQKLDALLKLQLIVCDGKREETVAIISMLLDNLSSIGAASIAHKMLHDDSAGSQEFIDAIMKDLTVAIKAKLSLLDDVIKERKRTIIKSNGNGHDK